METLEQEQKDKIVSIISDLTGVSEEKITEESKLSDELGLDSLDLVEVVMKLEEEFDCSIPDEDYETSMTVGSLFEIVSNRIN